MISFKDWSFRLYRAPMPVLAAAAHSQQHEGRLLPFVVALCANGSARIDDRRVVHTVLFPDGGSRVFTAAHVRSGRSERRIISSTETTAVPVVTLEEITAFTWYKGM